MIQLDNFEAGQHAAVSEVYQRCILVSGKCHTKSALEENEGHVMVEIMDESNQALFPDQRWPMCRGYFKALVLLSPGLNKVTITSGQDATSRTEISLRYVPLLQTPPLHLAIMIAKDSPLLIDCPPAKFGGISSAHSSLDAAIAKFRMSAYMWQALTAEDLRAKGLGRRAFRIEEEWTTDTLTQRSLLSPTMNTVPKVHLIRTDKTVAELRDANLAQQNPRARQADDLHTIFTNALLAHGAPFTTHARPIVAGLILDSHYNFTGSTTTNNNNETYILAHAALGNHDPSGLSLGMFGSHLTYAWPRFMEEIPACLLDATPPGDTVGNDNGECNTLWQACAVGQGAFLHEVGHALGAPHTEGIMLRGYSPNWPRAFLGGVRTREGKGGVEAVMEAVVPETGHECRWAVSDALRFRALRHFWMPGDVELSKEVPSVSVGESEDGGLDGMCLEVACEAGIARVVFSPKGRADEGDDKVSIANPVKALRYLRGDLAKRFAAGKPLGLEVTAMNGKQYSIGNVWDLFRNRSSIQVPGTNIKLLKQSVSGGRFADGDSWTWAVMLKKRDSDGNLVDASKIDIRVGCSLDGAVVYYKDGTKIPCGPRGRNGNDPHMGGHQARKMALPQGVEVSKVGVTRENMALEGLRMWLSNGKAMGALNCRQDEAKVEMLVPPSNHRIIGFYGTSGKWGMCSRFGIVTAPRDADLPDSVYDMEELQNKPEEEGHRGKRRRTDENEEDGDEQMSDNSGECDEDTGESCSSEDEDGNYDDGSDSEMERIYQG